MSGAPQPAPNGAPAPRTVPPVAAARAAGLEGAATATVTPLAASHTVHRVTAAGGAVIVKTPDTAALAIGRTLAAEAFAYRVATWHPGMAAVVPPVLLVDERRQVVVLAACDEHASGRELLARGALPDARAAAALGRSLATVHRETAGLPIPFRTSAGVLELTREVPPAIVLERARPLALAMADDVVLGPALTRARLAWHDTCLVHGDVKWDNTLVADGPGGCTALLIDWELSGLGDPAWDVAAALAGSLALEQSLGIDCLAERRSLATGYWSSGGTADPRQVALCCPARLVQLALECAEAGADAQAEALLASARSQVHGLERLHAMLEQWARDCRPASAAS